MNIFLFDFDDSFSWNILSSLTSELQSEAKFVKSQDFETYSNIVLSRIEKTVVILGPGPGHPKEYRYTHSFLEKILSRENIFICGICLGHQILWDLFGQKIVKKNRPIHGQSVALKLSDSFYHFWDIEPYQNIQVQQYHSLTVDIPKFRRKYECFNKEVFVEHEGDEFLYSFGQNFLTYQFHPESVGTSYPEIFFRPVCDFLL